MVSDALWYGTTTHRVDKAGRPMVLDFSAAGTVVHLWRAKDCGQIADSEHVGRTFELLSNSGEVVVLDYHWTDQFLRADTTLELWLDSLGTNTYPPDHEWTVTLSQFGLPWRLDQDSRQAALARRPDDVVLRVRASDVAGCDPAGTPWALVGTRGQALHVRSGARQLEIARRDPNAQVIDIALVGSA